MKNSLKLSKEARAYTQMISKAAAKTARAIIIHAHTGLSFFFPALI